MRGRKEEERKEGGGGREGVHTLTCSSSFLSSFCVAAAAVLWCADSGPGKAAIRAPALRLGGGMPPGREGGMKGGTAPPGKLCWFIWGEEREGGKRRGGREGGKRSRGEGGKRSQGEGGRREKEEKGKERGKGEKERRRRSGER